MSLSLLREHARAIWQAAVDAARPDVLIRQVLAGRVSPLHGALSAARRILVVGAGKAGAAMAAAVEASLPDSLERMKGVVNVPAELVRPLRAIELHAARPAGSNFPTAEGIAGTRRILELVAGAGPEDVCLRLLSGGGSALLPAPAAGLTLEDDRQVTHLLHASGATIQEMNAVRKHLSTVTGGRLAQAFTGRALFCFIISDVVGDPLDVIASGPTAADPTTFADALAVCQRYDLLERIPAAILALLKCGIEGKVPETPKRLSPNITNQVIGNNVKSLAAARLKAEALGYRVLNLGSYLEGETSQVATVLAGLVRSIRIEEQPMSPPLCVLSGGETTVTLAGEHGRGGRNQEFVLAVAVKLGSSGLRDVVLLSGGTDGEDGPTDAAGAIADASTLARAAALGLSPAVFLARHDAYSLFAQTGDLLKTGLTETNVMDVRVILVA